jgi:hypothetical protein
VRHTLILIISFLLSSLSAKATAAEHTDSIADRHDMLDPAIAVVADDDSIQAVIMDSVTAKQGDIRKAEKRAKRDWATWKPNPKRAMWLAIMLPGAGQIYNRKYWKLPIVYGGFIGCAYAMRWNNQMYMDYSQAYLDIMDNDPNTKSYEEFLHLGNSITPANIDRYKQIFKSRKDRYRRWRDLSFIVMMAVYAVSIVDAYVDASLSQFDISDDLSLRMEPAVINGNTTTSKGLQNSGIGMHAALTF